MGSWEAGRAVFRWEYWVGEGQGGKGQGSHALSQQPATWAAHSNKLDSCSFPQSLAHQPALSKLGRPRPPPTRHTPDFHGLIAAAR